MNNLQTKSHQALLTVLNNIGVLGAILAGIADIIFVVIFVFGINIDTSISSTIIFAVVNALIGLLINILLRYQGIKYAEIENEDLLKKFYSEKAKTGKEPININTWQVLQGLKDFIVKGFTTVFSIFGVVYISIQGSKNPIQLLITLVSLVLFACFGLINMNSSYYRYYNIQIPYMENKIKEKK